MEITEIVTSILVFMAFGYLIVYKMRQKPSGRKAVDWISNKMNPKNLMVRDIKINKDIRNQLWIEKRNII